MDSQPASPLEELPTELHQQILARIPDISSLRFAILSSSALHQAFKGHESHILESVLLNQLGPNVLPEAAAVLASRPQQKCGPEYSINEDMPTTEGITTAFNRINEPRTWTMSKALELVNLHKVIQNLFDLFIAQCTSTNPDLPDIETRPCTAAERARIERAFLRFELFRNIFHALTPCICSTLCRHIATSRVGEFDKDIEEDEEDEDNFAFFWSHFSVVEIEQITCVHDFLARIALHKLNRLASHEIVWAGKGRRTAEDLSDESVQRLLSGGLLKIYELSQTDCYDDLDQLLRKSLWIHWNELDIEWAFDMLHDDKFLEYAFDILHDHELKTKSLHPDQDTGPEDCFMWTGASRPRQANAWKLRKWGYVFWDRSRLDSMALLDTPYCLEYDLADEFEHLFLYGDKWYNEMRKIYQQGGRGWWGPDDDSNVTWINGKPPTPEPVLEVEKVKTEAKEKKSMFASKEEEEAFWNISMDWMLDPRCKFRDGKYVLDKDDETKVKLNEEEIEAEVSDDENKLSLQDAMGSYMDV